jgi:hypothetical protein
VIIFLKTSRTFRDEQEKHFYFLSTYKYALEWVFGHAFFPLRIMMTELAIPYYLTYRKKKEIFLFLLLKCLVYFYILANTCVPIIFAPYSSKAGLKPNHFLDA